jgi:hypothetical protein
MLKFNWRKSKTDADKLRLGDVVKVKCGTEDPDYKGLDISDYAGRVKSVDDSNNLILIELDSVTLKSIDENRVRQIIADGFNYREIRLDKDDVIKIKPRDTLEDVLRVINTIDIKYNDS